MPLPAHLDNPLPLLPALLVHDEPEQAEETEEDGYKPFRMHPPGERISRFRRTAGRYKSHFDPSSRRQMQGVLLNHDCR